MRNRTSEESFEVPFHRRHLNSFPQNWERKQGEESNDFHHPKILAANCKGHVQTSKAIRRHLGLPPNSKSESKEQESSHESPNISYGLAAAVHHKVDDVTDCHEQNPERKTGILKKPKCRNCSNNNKYSVRSFKSEKKTQFKNISSKHQTKTTFMSDTNLLDGKLNSNHILMKEAQIDESIKLQDV